MGRRGKASPLQVLHTSVRMALLHSMMSLFVEQQFGFQGNTLCHLEAYGKRGSRMTANTCVMRIQIEFSLNTVTGIN